MTKTREHRKLRPAKVKAFPFLLPQVEELLRYNCELGRTNHRALCGVRLNKVPLPGLGLMGGIKFRSRLMK